MTHILDALEGRSERADAVRAGRCVRERDSVLGRYSLDEDGHTTSTAYGRLAVVDGELAWDRSRP
jgi:branched-chain amino acid transport system substrate-binding protein